MLDYFQGECLYKYPLDTKDFVKHPVDYMKFKINVNSKQDITGFEVLSHQGARVLTNETNKLMLQLQKSKIYLASDIFMMLSRFDTFGMTVLEAMAASLPVIISSNVGAKDLVRHGINGFIIEDTNNIDMICDRIGSMLKSKIGNAMAKEAQNTALNNRWNVVTKRIEDIYENILQI